MASPRCFISYAWDNESHKSWVKDFAIKLRNNGVEAILDKWHATPGDLLPEFMEREIRECDYVLIICSPKYKDRSDKRLGGVGYEGDIITGEIFVKRQLSKFIPILRNGSWEEAAPSYLLGKYYINLNDTPDSETNFIDLLATLFKAREEAPPVGKPPLNMLYKYSKFQKQLDTYSWTKFEVANLFLIKESQSSRVELVKSIRNALIEVFGENYKSFSTILEVKKEVVEGNEISYYSLVGHQRKFIDKIWEDHRNKMTKIIKVRFQEDWENSKDDVIKEYLETEKKYGNWFVDERIYFSENLTALNIEYDPELKRIKIFSDTDLLVNPKLFDNQIKTTSEAIRYTCAIINTVHVFLGDIGWQMDNFPLLKLTVNFLDRKAINLMNFRCQVEHPEKWDYINSDFEAEIKGYS